MTRRPVIGPLGCGLLLGLLTLALGRCDTVEPVEDERVVIEAFFDAGRPLPPLTLRRTGPLSAPYLPGEATAITDAGVVLELDGQTIPYRPDPEHPGRYVPAGGPAVVPPRAGFALTVQWAHQVARATGTIPPPVALDTVEVYVPERPVQAVLLDSLFLGVDSLNVGAREGFIYPVEVTLRWHVDFDEIGPDSLYWVETRLQPRTVFSSALIDFFLLPEEILRERTLPCDGQGRRVWTGVYAVPVEAEDVPLPLHDLRVALLRSGQDYARFATTRDAPERREPRSNVTGGLGIAAGISVDSLRLRLGPGSGLHGNPRAGSSSSLRPHRAPRKAP